MQFTKILVLVIFAIFVDILFFGLDFDDDEDGDNYDDVYNEIVYSTVTMSNASRAQELIDKEWAEEMARFRAYFEHSQRHFPEIDDCSRGECDLDGSLSKFCVECGLCTHVRTIRYLGASLSENIAAENLIPITNSGIGDFWYQHDAPTAALREKLLNCPQVCPRSTVRVPEHYAAIAPVILHHYNVDPSLFDYAINIIDAYTCPLPKVERICFPGHFWLRHLDNVDLDDKLMHVWAPRNKICLHQHGNVYHDRAEYKGQRMIIIFPTY